MCLISDEKCLRLNEKLSIEVSNLHFALVNLSKLRNPIAFGLWAWISFESSTGLSTLRWMGLYNYSPSIHLSVFLMPVPRRLVQFFLKIYRQGTYSRRADSEWRLKFRHWESSEIGGAIHQRWGAMTVLPDPTQACPYYCKDLVKIQVKSHFFLCMNVIFFSGGWYYIFYVHEQ